MKNTNIIIRCTDAYKESFQKEASELDMSISQYFRFQNILALNLKKNYPDFYNQLLELTKYNEF